jgi:cell division protein ZapE
MPHSPRSRYAQLIERCEISGDAGQEIVLDSLQSLYERLTLPHLLTPQELSLWERLRARFGENDATTPKGIYLWGGVGRGKSMLMDLFYDALPRSDKRRVHFHAFMAEIHAAIHAQRQTGSADALAIVAEKIADTYHILCFDELQVQDVADASILSRLFQMLFARGVTVVFTSNRPPEDLYLHGLQRDRFLPFIALVRNKMDVLEIASAQDYRQGRMHALQHRYLTPDDDAAKAALQHCFHEMIAPSLPEQIAVAVQGRTIIVPKAHRHIAWFHFADLCDAALGASDYLTLVQRFRVFFVESIPQLSHAERNQAKRFVTLIDVLYEARALLFCTADVPPEELYSYGDGHFEFTRTASRLREMMAEDYVASPRRI